MRRLVLALLLLGGGWAWALDAPPEAGIGTFDLVIHGDYDSATGLTTYRCRFSGQTVDANKELVEENAQLDGICDNLNASQTDKLTQLITLAVNKVKAARQIP